MLCGKGVYIYIYIYKYTYMYIYICMCIYMYMYIAEEKMVGERVKVDEKVMMICLTNE